MEIARLLRLPFYAAQLPLFPPAARSISTTTMSTVGDQSIRVDASPLQNAVAIFLAHFHVRRGNEMLWVKGEADVQGVEWKVLPSGSHAVERDVIYFETAPAPNGNHRIGVAAFRNRKLDDGERNSAAGNDDDDQRGARMVAVGVVVGEWMA